MMCTFLQLCVFLFLLLNTTNGDSIHTDYVLASSHRRSKPHPIRDPNLGNANERADTSLRIVGKMMLWKEPIEMMDMPSPCPTCRFSGVNNMSRVGPATTIELNEDQKRIKVSLLFPAINASCDCSFAYFVSGKADVQLQNFSMYLDIIVNFDQEDTVVRTIKVLDPGKVSVQFDGYGILGNIIDKFTWLFQGRINDKVTSMIATVVPRILREEQRERLIHLGMI